MIYITTRLSNCPKEQNLIPREADDLGGNHAAIGKQRKLQSLCFPGTAVVAGYLYKSRATVGPPFSHKELHDSGLTAACDLHNYPARNLLGQDQTNDDRVHSRWVGVRLRCALFRLVLPCGDSLFFSMWLMMMTTRLGAYLLFSPAP